MEPEKMLYDQPLSAVNPSFWSKLTDIKLNIDKLEENDRHIWGYSQMLSNLPLGTTLEVDSTSFNKNFNSQNMYIAYEGTIMNKNTIEQFKDCSKIELIDQEGKELYNKIKNGEVLKQPSMLNKFFVLSFADLKKYHYYYWFAYPVPNGIVLEKTNKTIVSKVISEEALENFYAQFKALDDLQKPYFIVKKTDSGFFEIHTLENILNLNMNDKKFYFGFFNGTKDTVHLRSQVRNYVALILHFCEYLKGKPVQFLAFNLTRENSKVTCKNSEILAIKMPESIDENIKNWVGWEKNERDKMGPRMANMKNTLDPQILAENAIDLNLKLMKWRILPDIDLDKIKNATCLLLGSGTLGCAVGRNLLVKLLPTRIRNYCKFTEGEPEIHRIKETELEKAWGVRNITFVDNSTVSFSNPVRQSLFTYEDSVNMRPKATAAAETLKKIFPGVNAKGYNLTISMPGHSVGETLLKQTQENVESLTNLIKNHDVIFLLMDSRESRWLPTLLGSYFNKVIINAALGFDSYLVMRHGAKTQPDKLETLNLPKLEGYKVIHGSNLGCYFCNDVTAPGNSTHDRTLDQQCTVTRPGVSQLASALATELAISLLQHNEGTNAPAFYKSTNTESYLDPEVENQCILGLIPHSIRGFLSSFSQVLPATMKYNQCIACSDYVLQEYKKEGFEFLLKVFNSSKYLEDLTHLTEMFKQLDADFGDILECSDDDFD